MNKTNINSTTSLKTCHFFWKESETPFEKLNANLSLKSILKRET